MSSSSLTMVWELSRGFPSGSESSGRRWSLLLQPIRCSLRGCFLLMKLSADTRNIREMSHLSAAAAA